MANNGFKINKSINLNPQLDAPERPSDGDLYFNSSLGSIAYYKQGAWACLDSIGEVANTENMTSSTFTPAVVQNSTIRVTGDHDTSLCGISASFSGKRVAVYNTTTGSITVRHNSEVEVTANNRVLTPLAGDMTLVSGELAQFVYDLSSERWLLVSIGSGAGAYAPATTATNGIVTLNAPPVSGPAPRVPVIDSIGNVISTGLTRGSLASGLLEIGKNAADTGVRLGRVGGTAEFLCSLTAVGFVGATLSCSPTLSIYAHNLYLGTDLSTALIHIGRDGVLTYGGGGFSVPVDKHYEYDGTLEADVLVESFEFRPGDTTAVFDLNPGHTEYSLTRVGGGTGTLYAYARIKIPANATPQP